MKALVLAGGTGSRLRPLTHTRSKQLLPVAGKPILFHALEAVAEACSEAVILVGDTEAEIRAACTDPPLPVSFVRQSAPLGLAHAVLTAEEKLADEPFLMFLGDNLLKASVRPFVERFQAEGPDAMVLLTRVPDPQRFGVVVRDPAGRVVRLVEKPAVPPSDMALVGIYLFGPSIFEAARAISPSGRGELEITDAIQHLVDTGRRVEAEEVVGWWKDTGKPEDLLEANRLVLADQEPSVHISPEAEVIDSELIGPVRIRAGCRVVNSTVGPDVALSQGVVIADARLSDAIVMEDTRISGVSLSGCLIGRGAVVERGAASVVIGDSCRVVMP